MGVIVRGLKNAFRNGIRTGSIVLILGLSMGLALVMLIAVQTVDSKIKTVTASIGNTISISPAGVRGFEGGGEPLTAAELDQVGKLAHVVTVRESLNDRLTPGTDTSLQSAIDPGTLGQRFSGRFRGGFAGGAGQNGGSTATPPANFSLPIMVTATNDPTNGQAVSGNAPKLTAGSFFDGNSAAAVAVVGSSLASKNNLTVGSTFQAYSTNVKVVGIYDAGNTFSNSGLLMPLKAVQQLSSQSGDVTAATVTVDSITNVPTVTAAIKNNLGDKADVVSAQDTSNQAIAPLQNIRTISIYSLLGALAAAAIIIFLSMLMVVRERRREVGVLKAIGASSLSVVTQFMTEAVALTVLGAVLAIAMSVVLSNPILKALSTNAGSTATQAASTMSRFGGQGVRAFGRAAFGQAGQALNPRAALQTLQAQVGFDVLLYGFMAAIVIAIIGSAIPAWLTTRIRPAEVMRGE